MAANRMSHYVHQNRFNVIAYVHDLHKAGLPREAAEIQGEFAAFMTERAFIITKADWEELKTAVNQNHYEIELLKKDLVHGLEVIRNVCKTDNQSVCAEIHSVRAELKSDIQCLRSELKEGIQVVRTELKENIYFVHKEFKEDIQILDKAISASVHKMMLFTFSMAATLLGVMAKGFHWI